MKRALLTVVAAVLLITMLCTMVTSCKIQRGDNPGNTDNRPNDPDDPNKNPSDGGYHPEDGGTYMRDAVGVTVKGTDIRVGYDFLPASD